MKDMASMRKMRRPSVAVNFGRGEEAAWGAVVAEPPSSCAVADFFRGGKR
jgi:hypothetical protein